MEVLRVARAGYAYRRPYPAFVERYKCLSKETWPHWQGDLSEGAKKITSTVYI
jgi:myosin-1